MFKGRLIPRSCSRRVGINTVALLTRSAVQLLEFFGGRKVRLTMGFRNPDVTEEVHQSWVSVRCIMTAGTNGCAGCEEPLRSGPRSRCAGAAGDGRRSCAGRQGTLLWTAEKKALWGTERGDPVHQLAWEAFMVLLAILGIWYGGQSRDNQRNCQRSGNAFGSLGPNLVGVRIRLVESRG